VAGCVWGDDSSKKIQYLDLSHISEGIIHRDERFGYVELAPGLELRQAVQFNEWADNTSISVATWNTFDLASGKLTYASLQQSAKLSSDKE
jgi:hypothetical protein